MALNDTSKTPRGIVYPTGATRFPSEDWWKALASSTDAAISNSTWDHAPLTTKAEIDSLTTPESSGLYPVSSQYRSAVGIPSGSYSGWVETVYINPTAVAQIFVSTVGETYNRYWGGASSGWTDWKAGTGSTSSSWVKTTPKTKAEVDGMTSRENSGLYPVNRQDRPTLGIPAGDASGWLEDVYVNSTAIAQTFTSLTGETLIRSYIGSVGGWRDWTPLSGGGASGGGISLLRNSVEQAGTWTTVAQMRSYLNGLSQHPLVSLKTIGQTVRGADIPAIVLGNPANPAFLAVGGLHGNELGNTHGLMYWARDLLEERNQILVDLCIIIVPMLNIDSWQVKRGNANDVDLNRDWVDFSQPETQAVKSLLSTYNVIGAVDGHSFGYQRELSMAASTAGDSATNRRSAELYQAISRGLQTHEQYPRYYGPGTVSTMMVEGLSRLGVPGVFIEVPSNDAKLYEAKPKSGPNGQMYLSALCFNAAAEKVWTWTPGYPKDIIAQNAVEGTLHDITSFLSVAPLSGSVHLHREGSVCTLYFNDARFPASSDPTFLIATLPEGWRPAFTQKSPMVRSNLLAQITQYGNVQLYPWSSEQTVSGPLQWITPDPMPTTIPGR